MRQIHQHRAGACVGRFPIWRGRAAVPAALALAAGLVAGLALPGPARAIPSFARQTGLDCNACHTIYPQLTALGRQFKMNGYTMGDAPLYKRFSGWVQGSYTHTAEDQANPPAEDFGRNDNFALDQASLFYGGDVFGQVGAFLQLTYDGVEKVVGWDNMDVRFADDATIGGDDVVWGVSLNNNPGVQDPLNSTPVWGFPFDGSALAPAPAAGTLIEDGLGEISLGASVYAMWNDTVYGEVGAYHTLSHDAIDTLTGDAEGAPQSDGVAPYWRLYGTTDWGANSVAFGTFGLYAPLYPEGDKSQGSDSYTDLGLDAQYQWTGDRDDIDVRARFVQEFQDLGASHAMAAADNGSNQLRSLGADASYVYDKTLGFTVGAARIWGDGDSAFYGTPNGSPDSSSLTLQFDWLPFNRTPWDGYPWFNPKLTLQYVHYFEFDGASDGASDNDTVFLLATATF